MAGLNIVNLTPHPVVILRDDPEGPITGFTGNGPAAREGRFAEVANYPASGELARARQTDEVVGEVEINGTKVPVVKTTFGGLTGLPEPQEGTMYVVSSIAAQAARVTGRNTSDLLVTSDPVRGADGKFIGVRRFALIV